MRGPTGWERGIEWDEKEEIGKRALSSVRTTNCLQLFPDVWILFFFFVKTQNPKVISQKCLWPSGLMAQCSLYDMHSLKNKPWPFYFTQMRIPGLVKHKCLPSRSGVRHDMSLFRHRQVKQQQRCKWKNRISARLSLSLSLISPCLLQVLTWPFLVYVTAGELDCIFYWAWQMKRSPSKQANVIFILRSLSIKLLLIYVSLFTTPVLHMRHINHSGQDLCGHCGPLAPFTLDINGQNNCWNCSLWVSGLNKDFWPPLRE